MIRGIQTVYNSYKSKTRVSQSPKVTLRSERKKMNSSIMRTSQELLNEFDKLPLGSVSVIFFRYTDGMPNYASSHFIFPAGTNPQEIVNDYIQRLEAAYPQSTFSTITFQKLTIQDLEYTRDKLNVNDEMFALPK